jgi:hypothetical protein
MALVGTIFIRVKLLGGIGGRWMENRMFLGRSERVILRFIMYLGKLCAILAVVGI